MRRGNGLRKVSTAIQLRGAGRLVDAATVRRAVDADPRTVEDISSAVVRVDHTGDAEFAGQARAVAHHSPVSKPRSASTRRAAESARGKGPYVAFFEIGIIGVETTRAVPITSPPQTPIPSACRAGRPSVRATSDGAGRGSLMWVAYTQTGLRRHRRPSWTAVSIAQRC